MNQDENLLRGSHIADRMLDDIRTQIAKGLLKPGDPLLTVRELTRKYDISYNSVRRALLQLAEEGLISLEQGRGTFVKGSFSRVERYIQPQAPNPAPPQVPGYETSSERFHSTGRFDSILPTHHPAAIPQDPRAYRQPPTTMEPASESIRLNTTIPPENERSSIPVGSVTNAATTSANASVNASVRPETLGGRHRIVTIFPEAGERSSALLEEHAAQSALSQIRQRLFESGDMLIQVAGHKRRGFPLPRQILAAGFDGVLLFGIADEMILGAFAAANELPCVLLDYWNETVNLNCVLPDHFSGSYLLTKQLIQAGHRELAFVRRQTGTSGLQKDTAIVRERLEACTVALFEEGYELRNSHILDLSMREIQSGTIVERIFSIRPFPTAIVLEHLLDAAAFCAAARPRGIRIPEDISVVCFGAKDEPDHRGFSSARVDYARLGETGLIRLRQRIAGAPNSRLRINIPVELFAGTTIAPPPGQ